MSIRLNIRREENKSAIKVVVSITSGQKERLLWYEVPKKFESYLTQSADPYVRAILFLAMEANKNIEIPGLKLSGSLVRNLEEFQRAWSKWKPGRYNVVHIEGDIENSPGRPVDDAAISTFTGGVDSSFTLYMNLLKTTKSYLPYPIRSAIFVHGFDIPLSEKRLFDSSTDEIRKVTHELQVPLVTLRTNLKEFGAWDDIHASAIISCMSLFGNKFNMGILGSSHPYDYLRFPWGSNPLSDPLLSSDSFKVINYGGGYSRLEKIDLLSQWNTFNENIRVCTEHYYHNCGNCEKCIRTKLCYAALNKQVPDTFTDKTLSKRKILGIVAFRKQEILDYERLRNFGSKHSKQRMLFKYLNINILLNRLIQSIIGPRITKSRSSGWVKGLKKVLRSITT